MRISIKRLYYKVIATGIAGSAFLLGGCDPTIQATVENGIINTSTSFLTALMQAMIQVYTEDAPS